MSSEVLTWDDFEDAVARVVVWARPFVARRVVTYVRGVPRGGLVLAVALSHRLGLPLRLLESGPGELLVDDIADTGKTLNQQESLPALIVTWCYHRQSVVVPDFWVHEKTDKWIHFPWENP